MLLVDYQLA